MTAFCKEMNWSALEALIGRYSARLEKGLHLAPLCMSDPSCSPFAFLCCATLGVRQELVALVAIPMVGRTRARQLFAAGTVVLCSFVLRVCVFGGRRRLVLTHSVR